MLDFGFYNMDCMDGMKEFPDDYFDLAIVDPPYGSGLGNGGGSRGWFDKYRPENLGGGASIGTGSENDSRGTSIHKLGNAGAWSLQNRRDMGGKILKKIITWDVAPKQEYFEELFRVSRNQIIWGGNYFALPPTRCFLVWRKTNVPEKFSMAMAEYAWTSFNGNAKVFEFTAVGQEGRFHPTQKPIALYKWLLSRYATTGDKILDTHVGSASSLIACRECGFKYVGFEIDEDYYNLAQKRLQAAENQMNLFDFINPYQE